MKSSSFFPKFRIGIVGSRDFPNPEVVSDYVSSLKNYFHKGFIVVSGTDAAGLRAGKPVKSCGGIVDATAWRSALACNIPFIGFPPEWSRFGRSAGMRRNALLAESGIEMLVVFASNPRALSPGSTGVVRMAKAAGVPVVVFGPEGPNKPAVQA